MISGGGTLTDRSPVEFTDASSSTNSSLPSLSTLRAFLDYAPEIRNAIYEHLFRFQQPVDICDGDYVHTGRRRRQLPRISGISLLRTCRKINEEAASVLYSSNDFKISARMGRDLGMAVNLASHWLQKIGQHTKIVRHFRIDCSSLCVGACRLVPHFVDLLPLLRYDLPKLRVTFYRDPHILCDSRFTSTAHQFNTESLNNIVSAIRSQPPSDLKMYLRCPGVVSTVELKTDASEVRVVFKSTHRNDSRPSVNGRNISHRNLSHRNLSGRNGPLYVSYSMSDTNTLLRTPLSGHPPQLKDLFSRDRIEDILCENPVKGPVVWDLGQKIVSPAIPALLHVARSFRKDASSRFFCQNFIAIMKSTDLRSNFGSFSKLETWLSVIEPHCPRNCTKLALYMETEAPATIQEVRIDALALTCTFQARHPKNCPTCLIQVHVRESNTESPIDGDRIAHEHLGLRLLYYILMLLEQFPHCHLLPSPAIFMDGTGELRDAQFLREDGSTETIICSEEPIPSDRKSGRQCAEKIFALARTYGITRYHGQDLFLGRAYVYGHDLRMLR